MKAIAVIPAMLLALAGSPSIASAQTSHPYTSIDCLQRDGGHDGCADQGPYSTGGMGLLTLIAGRNGIDSANYAYIRQESNPHAMWYRLGR
jgi:hypothetical protein